MNYPIGEIASILSNHTRIVHDAQIEWLLTDSRSLSFPENSLFFALHSSRNDGSRYIAELCRKGVCNFVVTDDARGRQIADEHLDANFIFVDDTLSALQRLAGHVRETFDIPVIAITGSNGKTVVKEWLYQLLSPDRRITRSPRSYNSQIGVPLSLWLLNDKTETGIFEAGISEPGEMQRLCAMIRPTIGLVTNIGAAHQENFSSMRQKCEEKLKLFAGCSALVCNADNELIMDCAKETLPGISLITWSARNADSYLYIKEVSKSEDSSTVRCLCRGQEVEYMLPFTDDASLENSYACFALCAYLGLGLSVIAGRMENLEAVEMRLEVVDGANNCILINDSYNSDLSSLTIALNFLQRRDRGGRRRKTVILSDLIESGYPDEVLYAQVADILNKKQIDNVIAIGKGVHELSRLYNGNVICFTTTTEFINSPQINRHDEIILIKGARKFHFEQIAERLEYKIHKTIMEIDLNAVIANLNHYRAMLKPGTKVVCMVKAAAYGNGAYEIARTLQDQNVDYLAVAVADEGVELREAGITIPIMVMDPEVSTFKTMFRYHLEPEVYDFRLLDELIASAGHAGITNYPVHIKFDTGMHRLGFEPKDLPDLVCRFESQSALMPRSMFSHFAGSDEARLDDFTCRQEAMFVSMTSEFQSHFKHKIIRHICNTAGIERFPQYHFDMVRLGLGLYGINPADNSIINNVSSLITTILQIRDIQPGETVGYGRRGTIDSPARIATIPIGYADGLNRHLGNRVGYCLVNGQQAEYVGNICMDACMIDVTGIDCKEGDKVEIFGKHLPVTVLADLLGTIPYEILTLISNRVKRIYFHD